MLLLIQEKLLYNELLLSNKKKTLKKVIEEIKQN